MPLAALCLLPSGEVRAAEALRVVEIDGQAYVSLAALARAAGGAVERLPGSEKVRLRVGEGEIVVVPGVSLVAAGRRSVRLFEPVRWFNGAVYVPVRGFLPLVEPFAPGRIIVKKEDPSPLTRTERDSTSDFGLQTSDAGAVGKGVAGREPWLIHTVVIDPGHGGKDRGAVGPTGLEEKEVALRVAVKLKRLIEERLHVRAVLTRASDTFVPLGERARAALEQDGRLFVSLHCNAARRPQGAGGTEVYFLSEARTDEAREVARRENAALELEENGKEGEAHGNPVLRDIFEGMSSDQFLKESQDLAADIGSAVAQAGGGLKDRGVKQAGFYVMKGTQARMPSVLVEMAFISSPREERLLRQEAFQDSLAEAIFAGIQGFKARAEQAVKSTQNEER